MRSGWPGVIGTTSLAPASVQDLWVAEADSRDQAAGQVLGDRTDWSPTVREGLAAAGMHLLAPRKTTRPGPHPWPVWLTLLRRRVDTVISQLVARSHAKRVWARDAWQLTAR